MLTTTVQADGQKNKINASRPTKHRGEKKTVRKQQTPIAANKICASFCRFNRVRKVNTTQTLRIKFDVTREKPA